MLDFDFDVVTGPSKATRPAMTEDRPDEPAPDEERRPAESATAPARSAGN